MDCHVITTFMTSHAQPGFFPGRGGFLEWGHVDKCLMCDK